MSLFTVDLVIRNNDHIILSGNRNDRTRYNVLVQRLNLNNINNLNSDCFYSQYDRHFYSVQLVNNNFIENINNNHIHNYIWNELNGITERNFRCEMYGIPIRLFDYIIGFVYSF